MATRRTKKTVSQSLAVGQFGPLRNATVKILACLLLVTMCTVISFESPLQLPKAVFVLQRHPKQQPETQDCKMRDLKESKIRIREAHEIFNLRRRSKQ